VTPSEFVSKWGDSQLRERQGSQSHFVDPCAVFGVPAPTDADQVGDRYCFERGAEKVGGGDGWADVWRKGCFGWEYKGRHGALGAARRSASSRRSTCSPPPAPIRPNAPPPAAAGSRRFASRFRARACLMPTAAPALLRFRSRAGPDEFAVGEDAALHGVHQGADRRIGVQRQRIVEGEDLE